MKKTTLEHLILKLIKAEVKENILKQPKKSYMLNSTVFNKALVGTVEKLEDSGMRPSKCLSRILYLQKLRGKKDILSQTN